MAWRVTTTAARLTDRRVKDPDKAATAQTNRFALSQTRCRKTFGCALNNDQIVWKFVQVLNVLDRQHVIAKVEHRITAP